MRTVGASIVVFGMLGVLLYGSAGRWFADASPRVNVSADFADSVAEWRSLIRSEGAEHAYEMLIEAAEPIENVQAHLLGHAFGEALYEEKGVDGIRVCDSSFLWGCLHQFVGKAIQERGTAIVADLIRSCEEHPASIAWGCLHGVGHGIQSYFGYDQAALDKAVGVCDAYYTNDRNGCVDGVFMEYNLRRMIADGAAADPRPFDRAHPFESCTGLEKYQRECIFALPYWWSHFEGPETDFEATYRAYGEYCKTLEDQESRDICFEGIGYAIGSRGSVALSRDSCEAASQKESEYARCIYAASRRMYRLGVGGVESCSSFGLSGPLQKTCQEYVRTSRSQLGDVFVRE